MPIGQDSLILRGSDNSPFRARLHCGGLGLDSRGGFSGGAFRTKGTGSPFGPPAIVSAVRILLNIIWLIFGGLWLAIGYVITGLICFLLIITIPFGIAAFRIAGYALWPFGRTAVRRADAGVASAFGNLIWLLVAGIWLALGHIVSGTILCMTVVGIPLGVASFKMVPIALLPLGRVIVPTRAAYAYPYGPPRHGYPAGPGYQVQPGYPPQGGYPGR